MRAIKKPRKTELFKPLLIDLSRAEWESINRHVEAYQDFDDTSRKLALTILNTIEKFPEQKEVDIFKKIKLTALRPVDRYALLRKLRVLILEGISLQVNLDRPGIYGNSYRQRITNSRKWTQATIFIEKNRTKEAQKLLEDIQSKALKYEHFDQLAQALETSLMMALPESTKKTLGNISENLLSARAKRNQLEAGTLIFLKARSASFLNGLSKENVLKNALEELDGTGAQHDIATITFYKKVLEADLFGIQGLQSDQLKNLVALADMCTNVPALQSTERVFLFKEQQVDILAERHDFKNAIIAIGEAQKLVKRDSFAYFNLQIKEIQIDLYQKKFDTVVDQMSILVKSRYTDKLPFALSYYNYFLAASEFYRGNTESAVKPILELLDENLANESSLDFMVALMAIQIAETLRATDEAKAKELSQKGVKKLDELKATIKMNNRQSTLLQVIKNMAESDFQPKKGTWMKSAEKLKNSGSMEGWKPLTLENFPLDEWIFAKAEKRKLWMKIKGKETVADS